MKKGIFSEKGGNTQWIRGLVRTSGGRQFSEEVGLRHSVNRRILKTDKLLSSSPFRKISSYLTVAGQGVLNSKLFGERLKGNTIRGNRTESLWEGNLPTRGSLRVSLRGRVFRGFQGFQRFSEIFSVLRSPLRGLCVQDALNRPTLESVSVHPVYGNLRKGLLRTFWDPHRVLRSPFWGMCVQGAQRCPSIYHGSGNDYTPNSPTIIVV